MASFLDPLIAFVSAHAVACLSHAVPRGPAGGRSGGRFAGAGIDHHPGPERAGARRRIEALGGAGGGHRRRHGRRRHRVLDRPSLAARDPQRLAADRIIRAWWRRAKRSSTAGARLRCFSPASCRRYAPSCRSRRARSACRRCGSTASIFPRSWSGRWRMCCRACWRSRRCTNISALPHHHGTGKHLWMLAVLGGALVIAVAIWIDPPPTGRRRDRRPQDKPVK